ncbi:MAG: hypothetical protein DRI80_18060 [Chloroflexota bacterium]|nr:MAG: hypothetical protein DRI80_18060 [Chloroflexota bacterium]
MSKLPRGIRREKVIKAFKRAGWKVRPTRKGKRHTVMVKEGEQAILSIPRHKVIKPGTLRRLLEDAGLTIEEFLELCR